MAKRFTPQEDIDYTTENIPSIADGGTTENKMNTNIKSSNEAHSEPLQQCSVSGSDLHGYRFKITNKLNNSVLGTGFMTASKPLDETEQMDLFHRWTHGEYLRSENYVSVSVFKAGR